MEEKRCALTGHRELPPDFDKNKVYDALEEEIRSGTTYFYCGMARGFDLVALSCLIDLKKKYRFEIEACIPYPEQSEKFGTRDRAEYDRLLPLCDKKTLLFQNYFGGCLLARNRYMVEGCDFVLAYCVQDRGGAAYTVDYAKKQNKPVKNIV